jgi:uncharacterized protein (TIGR02996 family)
MSIPTGTAPMTDHDALLRAIAAHPEEDTPRLMYADWLEENGRPDRAEFVRVQVELARFGANDPTRRPWVIRNLRFLRDHVPGWKAGLPQLPGVEWGDFNRGLVEEVQAQTEVAVVRYAAAIFAEPAVHILRLTRLTSGRDLAAVPELVRVRVLRLIGARAEERALQDLLGSPYLGQLTALDLDGNRAGNGVAANLADGRFPVLEELWLGSNRIGDAGGHALAESPHLDRLTLLDLRGNSISASVKTALRRRFGPRVKL